MAKQDDWVRLQLRLPPTLHAALVRAADSGSLNAEIVLRLQASFAARELDDPEIASTPSAKVALQASRSLRELQRHLMVLSREIDKELIAAGDQPLRMDVPPPEAYAEDSSAASPPARRKPRKGRDIRFDD